MSGQSAVKEQRQKTYSDLSEELVNIQYTAIYTKSTDCAFKCFHHYFLVHTSTITSFYPNDQIRLKYTEELYKVMEKLKDKMLTKSLVAPCIFLINIHLLH